MMTALTQEEIMTNTKTVVQGLETLRNEHNQILNSLVSSMKTNKQQDNAADTNLVDEKRTIITKSIDGIELGIGEAQVRFRKIIVYFLHGYSWNY